MSSSESSSLKNTKNGLIGKKALIMIVLASVILMGIAIYLFYKNRALTKELKQYNTTQPLPPPPPPSQQVAQHHQPPPSHFMRPPQQYNRQPPPSQQVSQQVSHLNPPLIPAPPHQKQLPQQCTTNSGGGMCTLLTFSERRKPQPSSPPQTPMYINVVKDNEDKKLDNELMEELGELQESEKENEDLDTEE